MRTPQRAGWRRVLFGGATGALVLSLVGGGKLPAEASTTARRAGHVANRSVTPTFTLTWSRSLPDAGHAIQLSSPIPATLDSGGQSVVFGDTGGNLWAFHVADGSTPAGWPVHLGNATDAAIDSTPSAGVLRGASRSTVFIGVGSLAHPAAKAGFQAINPDGTLRWARQATDVEPAPHDVHGVVSGLTLYNLGYDPGVVAGTTGQDMESLSAGGGHHRWSLFTADSVQSTAAIGHLYGTRGGLQIVIGGDSTYSPSLYGIPYASGGHLRIVDADGRQDCQVVPQPDQTIDSSPAIGPVFGSSIGIVTGTGGEFKGAKDTGVVLGVDTNCKVLFTTRVSGTTTGSPALADVLGTGRPQVVEESDPGSTVDGLVYLLENGTGRVVNGWPVRLQAPVAEYSSPVTAYLTNGRYQDVIAPTATNGADVVSGRTHRVIAVLAPQVGLQNAPLVTRDPNGRIGITLVGIKWNRTVVDHYEVSPRGGRIGTASWPMFHHDPQLSGNLEH